MANIEIETNASIDIIARCYYCGEELTVLAKNYDPKSQTLDLSVDPDHVCDNE